MEYPFGSLWTAEDSPRNFLVLVPWIFSAAEEYPVVHGAEHVGSAYRRLLAHSNSSPLISIRDQLIKTSLCHIFHTVCCNEIRTLRLGCWKHVILGSITDLSDHRCWKHVILGSITDLSYHSLCCILVFCLSLLFLNNAL